MKAADVMETDVLSVYPDTSVNDLAKLLLKNRISAVPVVDNGKLVGIVSEGDLIRRVETDTARHRSWWLELLISDKTLATDYVKSHARFAGEVMSRPVVTANENTSLNDIAKLFESHNIKRVPVVRGNQMVGIVSRADLLRLLASLHEKSDPAPVDDDALQKEIMKRMKAEPWFHSAQIEVGVRDGVVKIEGIAMSHDMQMALRVLAENVPGVRAVTDATRLKSSVVE
jgi:CBS domain-containing protein